MRPRREYEEAMRYSALGMNDCEIARLMELPHGTIRGWRSNGLKRSWGHKDELCPVCGEGKLDRKAYAYLLGMYLGGGHIVEVKAKPGVYRLSIFLDVKYPGIIQECRRALVEVRTNGSDKITQQQREGCVTLSAHWKHWRCLFPQHGPGMKHTRLIELAGWQEGILREDPRTLLRGLIHSDGCRGTNTIRARGREYKYPRYQFSNNSLDIQKIFCRACDAAGVNWKQMNSRTIAVSRREDVAKLDGFIGPKR